MIQIIRTYLKRAYGTEGTWDAVVGRYPFPQATRRTGSVKREYTWIWGAILLLLVVGTPIAYTLPRKRPPDDPQKYLQQHPVPQDHSHLVQGPFETPQDVTKECLRCHPDAAKEIMSTTHWTWEGEPVNVPWRETPVSIGKKNQINNFCISIMGNQHTCTSCHAGYGWNENEPFDFTNPYNVDCLVCHADPTVYAKGFSGLPAEGVDLVAAAKSVRNPTRENCGKCHFEGGGGNNVKHGDLADSLIYPPEYQDVHMGKLDFQCTDCHRTEHHQIKGKLLSDNYIIDPEEQVHCTDCHSETPHQDDRLNFHTKSVACQTCHIPEMAPKDPTKVFWDWSKAGEDRPEDHYTYLKIKGEFVYERHVTPVYRWFNGNNAYRYILGDKIDPTKPTMINEPAGDITDPKAKIFPFKIHRAIQPYDKEYKYLLAPITSGPGGFWHDFDWDKAFRLAESVTGLKYSGEYGWTETWMYWPTTHMVQPAEHALQCQDCHSPNGRMDWKALGYPGDPKDWGGRYQEGLVPSGGK